MCKKGPYGYVELAKIDSKEYRDFMESMRERKQLSDRLQSVYSIRTGISSNITPNSVNK